MSDQVFRYNNKDDYMDPYVSGIAVSKKFATLEEADRFQALMRKGDCGRYYYGICHRTQCAVFNVEDKREKNERSR